jgi:hypothetical protein
MDLIIAILIALGLLASPDLYDERYEMENRESIERAQTIVDNGWYKEIDGGIVVDEDIDF